MVLGIGTGMRPAHRLVKYGFLATLPNHMFLESAPGWESLTDADRIQTYFFIRSCFETFMILMATLWLSVSSYAILSMSPGLGSIPIKAPATL